MHVKRIIQRENGKNCKQNCKQSCKRMNLHRSGDCFGALVALEKQLGTSGRGWNGHPHRGQRRGDAVDSDSHCPGQSSAVGSELVMFHVMFHVVGGVKFQSYSKLRCAAHHEMSSN